MECPDPSLLRAFAEPEGVRGLVPDAAALEHHVAGCPRCLRVVEHARAEEKLLRGLAPPRPRGAARALERTLARLDEPAGASALPRVLLALVAAVGAAGLLLVFSIGAPPATAPPDASGKPVVAPAPPPVAPPAPPPVAAPPPGPVAPPPGPVAPAPPPPVPESPPGPEPVPAPPPGPVPPPPTPPEEPTPPITRTPESPATSPRALAFARSGRLSAGGRELAPGAALPESVSIAVGAACAEVESVGSAALVLAPRSTFTVAPGEKGEPVFTLTAGKLAARSHGAAYAVLTRDGRATPCGTSFVVSLDASGTRVTTLEGEVELEPSLPGERARDGFVARVRPGFEGRLVRGKRTELPAPSATEKAVEWLPREKRPRPAPLPRLLAELARDEATGKFPHLGRGELLADGCLRGAPADGGTAVVQLVGPKLVPLDPEIWFEAVLRVDRSATVTLMVWDDDVKENFAVELPVGARRFTTVAAPLRDFTDKGRKGRSIGAGDSTHELNVIATAPDGARVELLLERVRFYR